MTVQTNPLYSMNIQVGNQLLKEINKAIQSAQANQAKMKKAKHPYALPPMTKKGEELELAPTPNNGAGDVFGALLGSLFLDMFFGMPLFQGLGDATRGLAQIGLMNAVEDADETPQWRVAKPARSAVPQAASFDEILMTAEQTEHLQAVASQTNKTRQMVMLRQLLVLMVTQMLAAQDDSEGKSGGGSDGLVPDVLRDPKLARFKQNRQSIACIRTLFHRQSEMVAMPKHRGPHLRLVA